MRRAQNTRNTSSRPLPSIISASVRSRPSSLTGSQYWAMVSTVAIPLAVAISTGSRVDSLASLSSDVGKVAEKSIVWRFSSQAATIARTSSMKPISSILSASSSTTNSVQGKLRKPWFMRSSTRPGVATTTCAPPCRALTWGTMSSPPTMKAVLIPRTAPSSASTVWTWSQSSRVGQSTSPSTLERAGSMRAIMGAPKARVLPVPVSALAITSRPSSTGPMAMAWIGVGRWMPMASMAARMGPPRSHSVKESTSGGSSMGCRGSIGSRRVSRRRRGRPVRLGVGVTVVCGAFSRSSEP